MKTTEISEEYIAAIIRAVRVSDTPTSREEITRLIHAALADMQRQGVDRIDPEDPLTKQAVVLYCKAHYGYDKDSDRFAVAYASLAASMSLCGDYDDKGGDGDE